jgi:serine/threonine protein kinase
MLYGAGFRVQEPLFWGSKGGRDYVVSREIKGIKMISWLEGKDVAPKRRREVLKHLGEEVGELHRTGFVHGDLRLSNILVQEDTGKPAFYFLDNERTRLHRRRIPRREIVKNLRQINTDAVSRLSRTDRLRIFQAYHAACGIRYTNTQKRLLLAEVEKRTAQRLAKG